MASPEDRSKALAAAAYNGLAEAVKRCIELGADPNAYNCGLYPGATPLHNAVSSGSLGTVRTLVELGASVEAEDKGQHGTPLEWAEYFERKHDAKSHRQYSQIVVYLGERRAGPGAS
jgi:peptide-methionine (S)-S-oxide reductase